MAQIHLFFTAVGVTPPALKVYAQVPVAIVAGLLGFYGRGRGLRQPVVNIVADSVQDARLDRLARHPHGILNCDGVGTAVANEYEPINAQ